MEKEKLKKKALQILKMVMNKEAHFGKLAPHFTDRCRYECSGIVRSKETNLEKMYRELALKEEDAGFNRCAQWVALVLYSDHKQIPIENESSFFKPSHYNQISRNGKLAMALLKELRQKPMIVNNNTGIVLLVVLFLFGYLIAFCC